MKKRHPLPLGVLCARLTSALALLTSSAGLTSAAHATPAGPSITSTSTISNTSPKTLDVLSVNTSFTTSDNSTPTGVTYTYSWRKNGGSQLSSSATFNLATTNFGNKGDVITCAVTPVKSGYTGVANTLTATVADTAPVVKDINLYTIGNHKVIGRPEFTDIDNDTTLTGSVVASDGTITFSGTDGMFLWDPTTLDATSGGTATASLTFSTGAGTTVTATLHGDAVTGAGIYDALGASDVQGKGASDYNTAKTDTSLANGYAPQVAAGLPARIGAVQLQRRATNGFTTADALRTVNGSSQLSLLNADAPKAITVWLGPNDALALAKALAVTSSTPTSLRDSVVSSFDSTFTSNYTTLLNSLRTNNPNAVIVAGTVPPVGTLLATSGLDADTLSRLNTECLAMSTTITSLANTNTASVVDLNCNNGSKTDGDCAAGTTLTSADISSDGFHPNDSGYTKLANLFLSKIPLDTTQPSAVILNPLNGSKTATSSFGPGFVHGTASDTSGITSVTLQLSALYFGSPVYYENRYTTRTTPLNVPITVSGIGTANVTWSLDSEAPTSDSILALQQDGWYGTNFTAALTVTDGAGNTNTATSTFQLLPEVAGATVSIATPSNNQSYVTGTFDGTSITGSAADATGVASVGIKLYKVVGGTKMFWNGADDFVTASTELPATLDTPNGTATGWTFPTVPSTGLLGTGTFTVVASATDVNGFVGTAVTRTFTVGDETTPPAVTITSPSANQVILPAGFLSGFINGTATDDTSIGSVTIKLSRTRGGVKSYWNGIAWVTTVANATEDLTGAGTTAGTWSLNSVPSGGDLDNGLYTIQAVATDTAGNSSIAVARNFTISSDATPPVASITTPSVNQLMLPATFAGLTTAGKVTDDTAVASVSVKFYRSVAGVKYFWDGTAFSTTAAVAPISLSTSDVHQFNWSLTTQPNASQAIAGSYSIQVTGRDASGNSATATCNFVLRDEITPPSLSISTPGVNQSLTATALTTVGIKGNVTDASGVASVSIKLFRTLPGGVKEYWNGAGFGSASVSVPGDISSLPSWSLATMPTTGQLSAGAYGLSVTAVDALGNTSSPVTRNFSISGSSSALKFNSSGKSF